MNIRILPMKVSWGELQDWLNNKEFINMKGEWCASYATFARLYDEDLQKYYKKHRTEPYYTFDEWRKENTILTKSELDLCYGSDNWRYEIIENDEDIFSQWLIVVLIEK